MKLKVTADSKNSIPIITTSDRLIQAIIQKNDDAFESMLNWISNPNITILDQNKKISIFLYCLMYKLNNYAQKLLETKPNLIIGINKAEKTKIKNLLDNSLLSNEVTKLINEKLNMSPDIKLIMAVKHNDLFHFKEAMKAGANPNLLMPKSKDPILNFTLKLGYADFYTSLLEHPKIDLNTMGSDKATPLSIMIQNNMTKTLKNNIKKIGNLNQLDRNGYLPVEHAIQQKRSSIFKVLLDAHASLKSDAEKMDYQNIFEQIVISNANECLKVLITHPRLSEISPDLKSLLEDQLKLAVNRGFFDIVQTILIGSNYLKISLNLEKAIKACPKPQTTMMFKGKKQKQLLCLVLLQNYENGELLLKKIKNPATPPDEIKSFLMQGANLFAQDSDGKFLKDILIKQENTDYLIFLSNRMKEIEKYLNLRAENNN